MRDVLDAQSFPLLARASDQRPAPEFLKLEHAGAFGLRLAESRLRDLQEIFGRSERAEFERGGIGRF